MSIIIDGKSPARFAATIAGAVALAIGILTGCSKPGTDASGSPGAKLTKAEMLRIGQSNARAALKRWSELHFTPLESFGERYETLEIERKSSLGAAGLSIEQRERVMPEIRRLMTMLTAADSATFITAFQEGIRQTATFSPYGKIFLREELKDAEQIAAIDLMKDTDLLERYWVVKSRLGAAHSYFTGLAVPESYYIISSISSIPDYPFVLFSGDSSAGYDGSPTTFIFDSEEPQEELLARRKVFLADVRIILNTRDKDVAYPIGLRLWWSTKRQAWTPWFLVESNNINHPVKLIF